MAAGITPVAKKAPPTAEVVARWWAERLATGRLECPACGDLGPHALRVRVYTCERCDAEFAAGDTL